MTLLIRQARKTDGQAVDVLIEGGRISRLGTGIDLPAGATVIDGHDSLLIPAFVNAHLHVGKAFWRDVLRRLGPGVARLPRFEAAARVKAAYTAEDVEHRVSRALELAMVHGTCAIRLFVDVDQAAGLRALEGVLAARSRFDRWMTIEVAAFPQDGVFNGRGTEELVRESMWQGADLVGGIPWIERSEQAQRDQIAMVFELADEFGCDAHFVVDDTEDPNTRTLEMIAVETIQRRWQGRVAATQCNALAYYDDAYAARVVGLVRDAAIPVIQNAHVSAVTANIYRQPAARGLTRVKQLLAAGVPVATAQDDIDDWYYPFGRNDMLEVAQYMAHLGQFAWPEECHTVLDMVTTTAARILKIDDYGLAPGNPANLVLLDAPDWHAALQFQAPKSRVILKGEIAAQTTREERILVDVSTGRAGKEAS